jgi:hypothetical protein
MILHNIVPIKIYQNTFLDYISFNSISWNFNLDFKTYFILTTTEETPIVTIPRNVTDIRFVSHILNKIHIGSFSDQELKPVK